MKIINRVCICGHLEGNHRDETSHGLCWPCQGDYSNGRPMTINSVAHKFKLDNLLYLEQLSKDE